MYNVYCHMIKILSEAKINNKKDVLDGYQM